jgi:hypothetical protein
MKKPRLVSAAIIVNNNSVLLVKNQKIGKWGLPGGIEAWKQTSDPFEAVILEVQGDIDCIFTGKFHTINYSCHPDPTLTLFYEGTISENPRLVCKNIVDCSYFTFSDILKMDLAYDHNLVLKRYIKN